MIFIIFFNSFKYLVLKFGKFILIPKNYKFGDNLYIFLMLIFTFLVAMTDYFCCGAPESYEGLCPSDIVLITLLEPSNKAKF